MPERDDSTYFAERAVQAKLMAERAATPAARNLHLALAADYDEKADELTAIDTYPFPT